MSFPVTVEPQFIEQRFERTIVVFLDGNHQYVVSLTCEVCKSIGECIVCKCQHFFYCSKQHQAEYKEGHINLCKDLQKKTTVLGQRHNDVLELLQLPKLDRGDIKNPPLSACRLTGLSSSEDWNLHKYQLFDAEFEYLGAAQIFSSTLEQLTSRFCLYSALMSFRNYGKISKGHDEKALFAELRLLLRLDEVARFWQRLMPEELHAANDTTIVSRIPSRIQTEHSLPMQVLSIIAKVKMYTRYTADDSQDQSCTDIYGLSGRRKEDMINRLQREIPAMVCHINSRNEDYWPLLSASKVSTADRRLDRGEKRLAVDAWDQTKDLWLAQPGLLRTVETLLEKYHQEAP